MKQKAKDVCKHVDSFLISVDAIGEEHDKMRGVKGMFKKVLEGIEEVKKIGINDISLWTVINKDNYRQVEKVSMFSKQYGCTIQFSPMHVVKNYNENLALDEKEIKTVFAKILELKKRGLPIVNTDNNLEIIIKNKSYKCDFPKKSIMVKGNGDVYSCEGLPEIRNKIWGNIRKLNFDDLFSSNDFCQFNNEVETCNSCRIPCVLSSSYRKNLKFFPQLYPYLDQLELILDRRRQGFR